MANLNVLVSAAMSGPTFINIGVGEKCLAKIRAVSPTVKVTDVSVLLAEEQRGDLSHRAQYDALLKDSDVMFGFRLPNEVLKRAPNLKWLQMMSAGVERYLNDTMIASPIVITNASGLAAVPIAEWLMTVMLMFAKKMPTYLKNKDEHKWERYSSVVLSGKTVGIIGLGAIGSETARRAQAFGMKVIGCRRSQRRARYCDEIVPGEQLLSLLNQSDFVVIAVPWTSETNGMIGAKELAAMKPTAYLLNIGRGDIIQEQELIKALEAKKFAGAGLDVFSQEPLPPTSPLWNMPNVIMTPHVAGSMEDYVDQACDLFVKNLANYTVGKKLFNVVDKKRGY
jgi:phosphoglycerate dehydrogenase-like enzyme